MPKYHHICLGSFCILLQAVAGALLLGYPSSAPAQPLRSPDGKYEARIVGSGMDLQYQLRKVGTDRIIFTTYAQYPTANDVKAGVFSADSKQFAAAYHYGHKGNYTWIGIWNIDSGKLVRKQEMDGWIHDIPASVLTE